MAEDRVSDARVAIERARRVPILAGFDVTLLGSIGLAGRDEPLDEESSFQRLKERVARTQEPFVVRFQIGAGVNARARQLRAGPGGCELVAPGSEDPNLELIVDPAAWDEIVTGRWSLLEAFGRGHIRVRGGVAAAQRFAQLLEGQPTDEEG